MDINAINLILACGGGNRRAFLQSFGAPVVSIAADETYVYVASANRVGKFTHDGTKVWLKQTNTSYSYKRIAVAPNGNVIAAGDFSSTYAVVSYWNSSGTPLNVTRYGPTSGSGQLFCYGLAINAASEPIICGATSLLNPYTGIYSAYIARFNSSGALASQTLFGSDNSFHCVTLDSLGSMYLGGYTFADASGNNNWPAGGLAAKMSQAYSVNWQKVYVNNYSTLTDAVIASANIVYVGDDTGLGVATAPLSNGNLAGNRRNASSSGIYAAASNGVDVVVSAENSFIAKIESNFGSSIWKNNLSSGLISTLACTSKSIFIGSKNNQFFGKIPLDGTGLGSLPLNGSSYTYAEASTSLVAGSGGYGNTSHSVSSLSYPATQFTLTDTSI